MAPTETAITDIEAYLKLHQEKELLRLVVVGSVDDGKSTLIGRLLHDTHGVYEDQLSAVKRASTQTGMAIDFSLFTDGLKAEREQGITIDVAYRYFSTEKRKFIIADTPGHVQYTRNMATGASTANVAVILIDARLGVLQQSRRHAYIASLLGIPHLAVAVNKMDLPDCGQELFERICGDFSAFANKLSFKDVRFIPVSALRGDNIVEPSSDMRWYTGCTILQYLEEVPIAEDRNLRDFRYPVQYVLRPHLDYRGYAAEIASGCVNRGDPVMVLPSRKLSRVASIDTYEGPIERATAPMSVALTLEDNVDVSRGDMLVHPDDLPNVESSFDAMLVWMSDKELDQERPYLVKHTSQLVRAEFERVFSKTNLETLEEEPADTLALNDIGRVRVRCRRPLYFDRYGKNHRTGAFIVVDTLTNATLGAGMIEGPADRAGHRDTSGRPKSGSQISQAEREGNLRQRGAVLLLTGLPGAGKSRLAYAVERLLHERGQMGLAIDPEDAVSAKNVAVAQRPREAPAAVLELVERGVQVGWITLLAFASPDRESRERVRERAGAERYVEIFVNTPLATCREKCASNFYADSREPAYEAPASADLVVDLSVAAPDQAARDIVDLLVQRKFFDIA